MSAEFAATFLTFSERRISMAADNIHNCIDRLSDEQIWYRSGAHENAIGNLLLHLAGNIRQWILHGVDGQTDVRHRDEEFSLTASLSRSELLHHFDSTVAEARHVIANLPHDHLLTVTDPQPSGGWGAVTRMEAIYLVVGHLQQHTGQIILLTKQLTASDLDLTLPRKR